MTSIAVLGAGPVGLDAALAAADRGWQVAVYEQAGCVAGAVREWGHVRMFTPWGLSLSPRMRGPLGAPASGCPTGDDLAAALERAAALLPAGTVQLGTRVEQVAREGLVKSDEVGTGQRDSRAFRLLLTAADGAERMAVADVVLDCTGTYLNPRPTGNGGIRALGERSVAVIRRIPRVDDSWSGRRVLLVGSGYSAQTAARDLVDVGAVLTWAVRRAEPTWWAVEGDSLPDRAALVASSRAIAATGRVRSGVVVESFRAVADGVAVGLRSRNGPQEIVVDEVVSLVGGAPDASIYRQLQVHECYATEGVMALAATLPGSEGADCLAQVSSGVDALRNPEPRFFVLGSKSYGRNPTFLLRVGWEQVEEVFRALDSELLAAV
jgi:cation diffusion facilitator CzcD-associated flavoprotein CzcO